MDEKLKMQAKNNTFTIRMTCIRNEIVEKRKKREGKKSVDSELMAIFRQLRTGFQ